MGDKSVLRKNFVRVEQSRLPPIADGVGVLSVGKDGERASVGIVLRYMQNRRFGEHTAFVAYAIENIRAGLKVGGECAVFEADCVKCGAVGNIGVQNGCPFEKSVLWVRIPKCRLPFRFCLPGDTHTPAVLVEKRYGYGVRLKFIGH